MIQPGARLGFRRRGTSEEDVLAVAAQRRTRRRWICSADHLVISLGRTDMRPDFPPSPALSAQLFKISATLILLLVLTACNNKSTRPAVLRGEPEKAPTAQEVPSYFRRGRGW